MDPADRLVGDLAEVAHRLTELGERHGLDVTESLRAVAALHQGAGSDGRLSWFPDAPAVLGVDAGKGGWVGALVDQGRCRVLVGPTLAALVEMARESSEVAVVAVDIPIGLPDSGRRQADVLARRALPGRASSVFTTLTRAAYESATYTEARGANLEATDGELGAGAQSYALRERILDVDGYLRTSRRTPAAGRVTVIEVHPELCFARLAGAPVLAGKRTPEGLQARVAALSAAGFPLPSIAAGPGYAVDDLLDACAAAWSAARHALGLSESFPERPEVFSDGIPAAIRV
jgi:predicted RNase H-like nuclease